MTEIILAAGGIIAVAAYSSAAVVAVAIGVIEKSTELAQMVAGVAHLNPGTHPQCDGSPS